MIVSAESRWRSDSELEQDSTIRKFRIVQTEGCRRVSGEVTHYNLQMIIAVGFKVNNERVVPVQNKIPSSRFLYFGVLLEGILSKRVDNYFQKL